MDIGRIHVDNRGQNLRGEDPKPLRRWPAIFSGEWSPEPPAAAASPSSCAWWQREGLPDGMDLLLQNAVPTCSLACNAGCYAFDEYTSMLTGSFSCRSSIESMDGSFEEVRPSPATGGSESGPRSFGGPSSCFDQ